MPGLQRPGLGAVRGVPGAAGQRAVTMKSANASFFLAFSLPPFTPNACSTIPCPDCSGQGWLQCEVCQGERVNVKVNKRLFRRCPGCYALGMTLCQKCKVYKCVTFPDGVDGGAVDD
ncbi:unnamed protein product [Closterium sp. NIES-65]|nr:unnamed protein product [Closterium sp. NIES-65]